MINERKYPKMKSSVKYYEGEGIKYQFNASMMNACIGKAKMDARKCGQRVTKSQISEKLADLLFVSTDAIKNWMYGVNGPADIEQVKTLGDFFHVDYHELLKKEDVSMERTMMDYSKALQYQKTKDCVREIYAEIVELMEMAKVSLVNWHPGNGKEIPDETREVNQRIDQANIDAECNKVYMLVLKHAIDFPVDYRNWLLGYLVADFLPVVQGLHYTFSEEEANEIGVPYDSPEVEYEELLYYFENEYIDELAYMFKDYMM